jgi:hypothetical protein
VPVGTKSGLNTFAYGESRAENAVEPSVFSKRASALLGGVHRAPSEVSLRETGADIRD